MLDSRTMTCDPTLGVESILEQWLAPTRREEFLRLHWRRLPFAMAGTALSSTAACTWRHLEKMLLQKHALDCLVVARGRVLERPVPNSLDQLWELFEQGVGIVVRQADAQCPELARLCEALKQDVPGEQRTLVFATPAGVHGFGWHYDAEDVFIVQTAGIKEYFFRQNTIDLAPKRGAQPDFSSIARETSPLMSCRLLPGDWLYLPRGYWHVAKPQQASLSISIGIFPS